MSEYILEGILNRISAEGAEVVARGVHEEEVSKRENESYAQLEGKCMEWALQECILEAIL